MEYIYLLEILSERSDWTVNETAAFCSILNTFDGTGLVYRHFSQIVFSVKPEVTDFPFHMQQYRSAHTDKVYNRSFDSTNYQCHKCSPSVLKHCDILLIMSACTAIGKTYHK